MRRAFALTRSESKAVPKGAPVRPARRWRDEAALIVAASILYAAHTLKPPTPTDRCWDISDTWGRQQNWERAQPQDVERLFGDSTPRQ
jgi:hypothetical protein